MPGSSNFLPFDQNNTNVMSDVDYLASPQRQSGVGNGIADPALHNKLFRQTSMMVSALAESLASKGYTVTDSDYAGLVTILNNIALTEDYLKTIDDLTDVIITNPQNKQLLTYNSNDSKWENKTLDTTIADNSVTDTMIGNRTADPVTATVYGLTGSVTQFFSWLIKRFGEVTGVAWGTAVPASLATLWGLKWTEKFILFNPADLYVSPGIPLSRNGTMSTMDFYVTGTPASATVITVKQNGTALSPTVSLSAAGKTTLTFSPAVTGVADDLFSYTVAGAGLAACTVVCNGKLVNR